MSTSPASSILYHVTITASSDIRLPRIPEHDASSTAACNCTKAFFIGRKDTQNMQKPKEWEQGLDSLPLKRIIRSTAFSFGVQLFWYPSVSVKRRRRITSVYHRVIRNSGLQTEWYAGSMCFFKCAQKVLWQG